MSLPYYQSGRKPKTRLAMMWMYMNAAIAAGMAFYWSGLAAYLAEPLKWATQVGVTPQPDMFEYPYVTLWLTPLVCMVAGWMALHANQDSVARIVGGYPSMFLVLMLGWYNFAPSHWL